jgi:hypothetical protein
LGSKFAKAATQMVFQGPLVAQKWWKNGSQTGKKISVPSTFRGTAFAEGISSTSGKFWGARIRLKKISKKPGLYDKVHSKIERITHILKILKGREEESYPLPRNPECQDEKFLIERKNEIPVSSSDPLLLFSLFLPNPCR